MLSSRYAASTLRHLHQLGSFSGRISVQLTAIVFPIEVRYRQLAMGNKRRNQNWDDLRYFLAVARAGTLSAAAKQLGTEHTTVARHIQALEDELNSRLFHKSNNGYGLTNAGERLLAGGEAIESAYVFAKAAASSEGRTIIGTVRIGAPDGFGSIFLAPRVRVLTKRHPGLEIEILTTTRPFSLLKREVDIAIAHSSPEQMRVVSRRLTDHRTYAYASRAYLDEAAPIGAREDLKQHPFDRGRASHPEHERPGAAPRHSVRKWPLRAARLRRVQLPDTRSGAVRASIVYALLSHAHSRRPSKSRACQGGCYFHRDRSRA